MESFKGKWRICLQYAYPQRRWHDSLLHGWRVARNNNQFGDSVIENHALKEWLVPGDGEYVTLTYRNTGMTTWTSDYSLRTVIDECSLVGGSR